MSYKAMDLVFEQHIADPQAKFVLIAIAKHADDNMQAFPSMNRLALLTGMSRRTVQRKINYLNQNGHLKVFNRSKGGKKTSNLYTVKTGGKTISQMGQNDPIVVSDCHNSNISNNKSLSSSIIPDETDCHHQEEDDEKETDWTSFANEILGKSNGRDDSKMGD